MKPGDIVEAEWGDHCFHFGEYEGQGLARQVTIGYFVSEDDETLRIAQSLTSYEGVDRKPSETMVIDKRTLIRRRKVRRRRGPRGRAADR